MQGTPPPMCHNMGCVSLANILLMIEPTFYIVPYDLGFELPTFLLGLWVGKKWGWFKWVPKKSEEWGSRHFTFVKKSCSLLSLSSTRSTIPTIWEMSFLPLSPLCQPVGRCPFEPQPLGSLQVVVFPMPKKKFMAPLSFVMWVLDIPFLANSSSSCISPGELMSRCSPYISYQVYEGCLLLLLLLLGTNKSFPGFIPMVFTILDKPSWSLTWIQISFALHCKEQNWMVSFNLAYILVSNCVKKWGWFTIKK
jgi:hypothetical protein